MVLRMVSLADAEALAAIYRPYVEETTITFEEVAPDALEFRRRIEEITAFYPYLVAEEAGHVVGYAYAHRAFERSGRRYNVELSIYIERTHQGRGIGIRLYKALLNILKLQNIVLCLAEISVPNASSVRLQQKLGFIHRASLPNTGCVRGKWCQLDFYEKQINPFEPKELLSVREIPEDKIRAILAQGGDVRGED